MKYADKQHIYDATIWQLSTSFLESRIRYKNHLE